MHKTSIRSDKRSVAFARTHRMPWFAAAALVMIGFMLATFATAQVAHANERLLGGRAFTPKDAVLPMPDDWVQAPITHKTPQPVDLAIALDQQLYPSLGPMVEAFAKTRGVRIAIQDGTCGISAGALSEKAVDIGGFCCPPGATDRLPGLKYHTIGIGALALIGHPQTPVQDLSLKAARALFGGDIRDWSELPMSGLKFGADSQVRAIGRLHCKLRPGHWRLILDDKDRFSWELQEVSAIADMLKQVTQTPGAIGYETLWHIDTQSARNGAKVDILNVDGFSPRDAGAVSRGDYPLYRVFNVTTWGEGPAHNALADELVAHLIENAGQIPQSFAIVPAARLRSNGWRFDGNELIGEPGS